MKQPFGFAQRLQRLVKHLSNLLSSQKPSVLAAPLSEPKRDVFFFSFFFVCYRNA